MFIIQEEDNKHDREDNAMELRNLKDYQVFQKTSLTKKIIYDTKDVLCFVLNLLPGHTIPVHQHEQSVLIASVLAGTCEALVNGKPVPLEEGAVLMVKGEDDFGIPAVKADLSLLVTLSPNPSNPAYSKGIE
jgi:quercetin dioxygenase-like cupin family protein